MIQKHLCGFGPLRHNRAVNWVPAVFSLLVAVAGFFYLQHAGGAGRLADLEGQKENALRIRLRRFGGAAMIGLALAFYVGFSVADRRGSPLLVLACLCVIVLLLPVILFLAWVDLRMTRRMREAIKKKARPAGWFRSLPLRGRLGGGGGRKATRNNRMADPRRPNFWTS
jgi:hypothetical protein